MICKTCEFSTNSYEKPRDAWFFKVASFGGVTFLICSIIWKYLSSTYCISYIVPVLKDLLIKYKRPQVRKGTHLNNFSIVKIMF